MNPSAGVELGGGASLPYGGPIVETDALIGVKCIACLERCQIQHPSSTTKTLKHIYEDLVVDRVRGKTSFWPICEPFWGADVMVFGRV